ncbi:MAG: hypothetical protein WCO11_08560 [Sphingomonadales bacterium]|jgi:hypothetical protein
MNAPHHPPEEDARSRRGSARSGDRLRWGLTGLAAIMLIVMVAAAGSRPTGREPQPGAGEPLAVLGVAPGPATKTDDSAAPPAPAPAPNN